MQRYNAIVVCEIERSPEDSKKLTSAASSEVFWGDRGFIRQPKLNAYYVWKEVGELQATAHLMVFWSKRLLTAS
jgi:hypothetical protein